MKKIIVQEKDLELSVQKITLGTLVTNAKTIKETVQNLINKYKADNYDEDTIDKAKNDRAMLNNTSKKLNDDRIKIEKKFMEPFDEFKDVVNETVSMIKEASSKIDVIVKDVENKSKENRKKTIEKLYKDLVLELDNLITLEQVFDEKWLNKGSFSDKGEFKKQNELESKLNKIRNDLETIKGLNSKHELALTNQYLKTFDLGQVISENNKLNELEKQTVKVEEKKEKIIEEKIQNSITKEVEYEEDDPVQTYKLEITGTITQLENLKEFLMLNEMRTTNVKTGKVIVE